MLRTPGRTSVPILPLLAVGSLFSFSLQQLGAYGTPDVATTDGVGGMHGDKQRDSPILNYKTLMTF